MSRYPLPLGTWGLIRTDRATARSWRARARYRDLDGQTRKIEARGPSAAAARRNLQIKLQKGRPKATPSSAQQTRSATSQRSTWQSCNARTRHRGPKTSTHSASRSTSCLESALSALERPRQASWITSFEMLSTRPGRLRPALAGPCCRRCSKLRCATTL
jgi:hypothetical protein